MRTMLRFSPVAFALILVTGASLAMGQQTDDQAITSEIQAKLFEDSVLKTRDIHVKTDNAVVTLSGTVETDLEKSAVGRIASTEPGVKQVIDRLTVADETKPARPASRLTAEGGQSAGVTVPAGSVVTIRMIDSIDSAHNQPGQEFDGTVDSPVPVDDRVVIPRNSSARVRLVSAQSSGRMKGSSELQLELVSVNVKGTPYTVESGYYQQHGASRGRRSAETIGGGAALGAIIGAIAGGRKGTAIGAGTGAAAGTAAQVATRGGSVKVPSETKLDFTLKSPLTLHAQDQQP